MVATTRHHPRVARVLVIDDGSLDGTSGAARAAGAETFPAHHARPGHPRGKGNAMSTGLALTQTPLVMFLDADVTDARTEWIDLLLHPLDSCPETLLVKGHYRRHLYASGKAGQNEGGRVNALLARPLLRALAPDLSNILQPLAGECAARTSALRHLSLEPGYAVEIGLLLDVAAEYGPHAIAQADLGTRTHRNRPLAELERHADLILEAVLRRQPAQRRVPVRSRIA